MATLIVLEKPEDWHLKIPGVEVVPARSYLVDPQHSQSRGAKVFNLCRSFSYQSLGYYVSLLAAARGHRPLPAISTIQDLKLSTIVRIAGHELNDLIQSSLSSLKSDHFELSVYFGLNLAKRYERLSHALFNQFPAPLLRAEFKRGEEWTLERIRPIAASEIPPEHRTFVVHAATEYFTRPHRKSSPRTPRYDLAILANEEDPTPPSDPKAIRRFIKAAEGMGFAVEVISKEDYGRIAEFDALLIRETTSVNHHTFRFSRRAAAEGLVVIDDPDSILKCTNKVYLAELLQRNRIATPRTEIVHKGNIDAVAASLGYPLVLKQPDSSFSRGVVKVDDKPSLERETEKLFEDSELLIAQEFVPTRYDWRLGVLDRQPLYACRYYMAEDHWQIVSRLERRERHGRVEAIPLDLVPKGVMRAGLRAANLIGDGLYGVDVKDSNGKYLVMEVNDNPSVDSGTEDALLGEELYERVVDVIVKRIEAARAEWSDT